MARNSCLLRQVARTGPSPARRPSPHPAAPHARPQAGGVRRALRVPAALHMKWLALSICWPARAGWAPARSRRRPPPIWRTAGGCPPGRPLHSMLCTKNAGYRTPRNAVWPEPAGRAVLYGAGGVVHEDQNSPAPQVQGGPRRPGACGPAEPLSLCPGVGHFDTPHQKIETLGDIPTAVLSARALFAMILKTRMA